MKRFLNNFTHDESGAVTVDWVVLTAAVCTLVALVILSMQSGTDNLSGSISTFMTEHSFF